MLDESLPIDLVLILLARVLLCDLEYFDKLSDSEPGPLTGEFLHLFELSHLPLSPGVVHADGILNFQNDVLLHGQSLLLNVHVNEPLIRHDVTRVVFLDRDLRPLSV